MLPAMSAPALRASSTSSASDSRSGAPAGCPGKRGERFHATPTSNARSVTVICWLDFIERRNWFPCLGRERRLGVSPSGQLYASLLPAATIQEFSQIVSRSFLNFYIVTKTCEPMHSVFTAKPGNLPLCILACGLLNCRARFGKQQFLAQDVS